MVSLFGEAYHAYQKRKMYIGVLYYEEIGA